MQWLSYTSSFAIESVSEAGFHFDLSSVFSLGFSADIKCKCRIYWKRTGLKRTNVAINLNHLRPQMLLHRRSKTNKTLSPRLTCLAATQSDLMLVCIILKLRHFYLVQYECVTCGCRIRRRHHPVHSPALHVQYLCRFRRQCGAFVRLKYIQHCVYSSKQLFILYITSYVWIILLHIMRRLSNYVHEGTAEKMQSFLLPAVPVCRVSPRTSHLRVQHLVPVNLHWASNALLTR